MTSSQRGLSSDVRKMNTDVRMVASSHVPKARVDSALLD